jgi:hypothetical protein
MNRDVRLDERFWRRAGNAWAIFILVGASVLILGWLIGPKSPVFVVVFLAAFIIIAVTQLRILLPLSFYYRCPQCKRRLRKVHEVRPAIHYFCPECNVQWDLGWGEVGVAAHDDDQDDDTTD